MRRQILLLLLPAFLVAACGQTPPATPGKTTPGAITPGTPAQQPLPGIFQIDFSGVGTDTPITRVQSLQEGLLSAQALIGAPDQFSFSQISAQTFTITATGTRHVRVTYKVTNTSSQTLRNPKFVAVVPQGSTTDSVFTNVRYFDGSDASATISKLALIQAQSFDTSTGDVTADPKANALLTGLDVSQVDTTGKGIKTLTQTGWWLTTPPAAGDDTFMAPGDSSLITFGVNVPMTSALDGGATRDPFSFSLNVTAVQDTSPALAPLTSAVKQWDGASQTFGNYVNFPTQTYTENGETITQSLPAHYDINELNGSTTAKVLCAGDAQMSVTNISTASFPNRWRVQLFSQGAHTLNVFEARSCPASGTPLLTQMVAGVGTSGTTLASGSYHGLALKADGTVQSWGDNQLGQLGDGTTTRRNAPITVSGLSGITSLAGGQSHSLALRVDGTVQSWGDNSYRQLGNGRTAQQTQPVTVSDLYGIMSIAAGAYHNLALKADGTAWSWGWNAYGQLGDSTTIERTRPIAVRSLSDIVSIAGGNDYSLALRADGTVWSWGSNVSGQLGDGTTINRSTPVKVINLRGVTGITAGYRHGLALKADGTIQSWGLNTRGQLGDGTTTNRSTSGPVSGLSGIMSIAASGNHSMALKADGTAWSWGWNAYGQLGDGATITRSTPGPISGLSGISSLAGGELSNMALKTDGTAWSWGNNTYGQLGDGTTTPRSTPSPVSGLSGVAQPTPY
ncbi:hypothetical protein [Deinococcus sp. Leaf326]|uniref:RCC1 domain-containing protein n=1 Tax=Deinococcus sp. Leaf326 TaxID=1736338 RepID=UPI0006FA71EB|nr:hypothetical protein [Deinococcus sp. Leaf326]KQR19991.1 hypothetical protein ASF71_19540 [Deinococcus sp. Leaf326]